MESDLNSRDEMQLENMSWEDEEEKSVSSAPPLFECPISLQVMTDPVTVCTGLTYDRNSIQQWLRLRPRNNICPASGQTLHTRELIPNHTLAALIHKWRLTNPSSHIRLHPTVEDKEKQIVAQIDHGGVSRIEGLRELKILARDESSRSRLLSEAVLPALNRVMDSFEPLHPAEEEKICVHEALVAILLLSVDARDLRLSGPSIRSLEWVLINGDVESRINAASLVERLAKADDTAAAEIGWMEGITDGLLTLLRQNNTPDHTALSALLSLCRVVAYRIKLAEVVGVVPLLIRFLSGSEREVMKATMAILEALSTVGQGRWEIMSDSVALPTIARNLVNVSGVATSHGLGILVNICKNCTTEDEIRDVLKTGVLQKIVALLHMDCDERTKRRANYLIKILSPLQKYDSYAQYVIHL